MHPESPESQQSSNVEHKSFEGRKFDAVIILDNIWTPKPTDTPESGNRMSIDGKMRALAAVELYKEGKADRFIFCGGYKPDPSYPSNAELMKDYFLVRCPEIPAENLFVENRSINTQENAAGAEEIVRSHGFAHVGVITNEYHLKRAVEIFQHEGGVVEGIPAEDLLRERTNGMDTAHMEAFVDAYEHSLQTKWNEVKEVAYRGLLKVDPDGKIAQTLSHIVRAPKKEAEGE
jgi:hypothetical protein